MVDYLNEYSEASKESSSSSSLRKSKIQGLSRHSSSSGINEATQSLNKQNVKDFRRRSTIRTLLTEYGKLEEKLQGIDVRTFDIFAFTKEIGREKTLPILGVHFFIQHHLDVYVNERKLAMFFEDVYKKYRRDV